MDYWGSAHYYLVVVGGLSTDSRESACKEIGETLFQVKGALIAYIIRRV